jgi:hypothetical protein
LAFGIKVPTVHSRVQAKASFLDTYDVSLSSGL